MLDKIGKWVYGTFWIIVVMGILVSDAPILVKPLMLGLVWAMWRFVYPEEDE